mmetsp:Transcript_4782/g.17421  ORF Transcript_4782/g.17421 Transcript_4782/m.17421 type:complete len:237 (-) Transcript_4782:568-1278(-)
MGIHCDERLDGENVWLSLQHLVVIPQIAFLWSMPKFDRCSLYILHHRGDHQLRNALQFQLFLDDLTDGKQTLERHVQVLLLRIPQGDTSAVLSQDLRRIRDVGGNEDLVHRMMPLRLPSQREPLLSASRAILEQLRSHGVENDREILYGHSKLGKQLLETRVEESPIKLYKDREWFLHPLHGNCQVISVLPVDRALVDVEKANNLLHRLLIMHIRNDNVLHRRPPRVLRQPWRISA